MNKFLIDTDVILDFFFDRKPFSENGGKILNLCESKLVQGFVTPVIVSNIYYLLRKSANHEKAIENVRQLLKIVDIVIIDKESILNALQSNFRDFEDAIQNFSAQNQNDIQIIITRNIKDFKTSTLSVMTPENYLKTFH